jgi:hypothetical protein
MPKPTSSKPCSLDDAQIPPDSRFRRRVDDGRDETYRINFVNGLTPQEMEDIVKVLLIVSDEGRSVGIVALTKVEFIEPDTCEYRFWCEYSDFGRVNKMFETWIRIHQVHRIRNIDGVPYTQYFPEQGS